MERVIFRHLTGSKANSVDSYPLDGFTSVLVGRDPAATLRYDATRDDLVGRQHARIQRDAQDPYRFTVSDLDSRNGTFVNRQRIVGTAAINPGDVVQFGPGGPEFEFQIDPLPEQLVKKTRLAASGGLEPTRLAPLVDAATAMPAAKPAVGAATVQRMVVDAQRQTFKRSALMGTAAATLLLAIIGVATWRTLDAQRVAQQTITDTQGMVGTLTQKVGVTPSQIAEQFSEATVFVEMSWKLIATDTGGQVYHEHLPAPQRGQEPIPVYLRLPDGTIEPALTLERGKDGLNQPIGRAARGSGFVVTNDGFILTNRHVAAPWETSYTSLQPGVVYDLQTRKLSRLDQPPSRWVPAASKLLGRRAMVGKHIEGRLDYLDVTFAKNRLRIPAKLVRVSDKHDAALMKVDLPQPVKKVELHDAHDQVKPGMAVTIMGYPAVSPNIVVASASQDPFSREAQVRVVPDPSITPSTIGRVLRGSQRPADGSEFDYFSELGDSFQLTDDAGGGNSGGPLFDDQGRVIGIYYAGKSDGRGAVLGFAVPIKYGIELMSVQAVVR